MNRNTSRVKKQAKMRESTVVGMSVEALKAKGNAIIAELKAHTWKDLEIRGKFGKNEKLSFISDDMLIVGCDIGSESHYVRAIDTRGRELSRKAFSFTNNAEGFRALKEWAVNLAAQHDKKQIVLGLEPTGHYWYALATWLVAQGISVVQVNPYAVKQTKELEDNSQNKDDLKDPKLIASLVKDGNYGMPYLPEGVYAEMRVYSGLRDRYVEDRIRAVNRLHRALYIVFPGYSEAFSAIDGAFTVALLKKAQLPADYIALGEGGIRDIWRAEKLKGGGYTRAKEIIRLSGESVGITAGAAAYAIEIQSLAEDIERLTKKIADLETRLTELCRKLPSAENILAIDGLGEVITSGILAELGDISRFDDAKEIQKISGLALVACSSGKHKGQSKISHRGRKKLRYWLFLAAKSLVSHNEAFKELHVYYTTRAQNPLKKMQSLIAIACKLLRIIFAMLRSGKPFDADKMRRDIVRPTEEKAAA